ncbi:MAG: nitroreductase family protein, partial [Solobacterium sp.]|nr:nitroreductase family protein [Solobacterium sp.]
MNEKISNLLARRSIRSYKSEPVREEDIQTIIEAGLYAASGMGRQSPIVIAVTDRKVRDELAAMNAEIMGRPGTDPFYGAPAVLVVLADKAIPTHVYDGALM